MNPQKIADELGKVRAEIANLEARQNELKKALLDLGVDEVEGKLFRVTVSKFQVKVVDYKGLIDYLKPKAATVDRFSRVDDRVRVNVVAR